MDECSTVVIGGGAAGICAAISRRRAGEPVVICEKLPQPGKKILATGNGRCNLLNDDLDETHYNPAARNVVRAVFDKFGKDKILGFFKGLGLETFSKDGRLFPVTNQASSVLKILEMELKNLCVPVECDFDCSDISFSESHIVVSSKTGRKIACRKVILTAGGMACPALGTDGSMYGVARRLGHTIIEPVPSAVPLVVDDKICRLLQGQRIVACARSVIDGKPGKEVPGELLFTKYGLSGTCILDISRDISVALNRHHRKDVFAYIDMVPFMDKETLENELAGRLRARPAPEEVLVGILPNKLSAACRDILNDGDATAAASCLKSMPFRIAGTRDWNEAEYTSGGINTEEINHETLESKLRKNVYFAGEILDVDGERGGYNLGWAWASGFIAGRTT